MSALKNVAEGFNEIYRQREKLPEMMDKLNVFVKENVVPDLIDIGCRIHQAKTTHSPHITALSIFFPRTVSNFKEFDKSMSDFLDEEIQKKNKTKTKKKVTKKENYFGIDK
jgi:hypothetical protein